MINNIIYSLIIIVIFFYIYLKICYRFWSSQPIFHKYNLKHWLFPCGIYYKTQPLCNKKFFNTKLETFFYNDVSAKKKALLYYLLKTSYLKSSKFIFSLTKKQLFSFFEKSFHKNYLSLYYDLIPLPKSDGKILKQKRLISSATSRILIGNIHKNDIQVSFLDFICIHSKTKYRDFEWNRTFYSHFYNSTKIGAPPIGLIKKFGIIPYAVPATVFFAYYFDTKYLDILNLNIPNNFVLYQIKSQNFSLLYDFLGEIKYVFDLYLIMDLSTMKELINNNILIPFLLMNNTIPIGVYFFKNELIKRKGEFSARLIGSYTIPKYHYYFTASLQNTIYLLKKKYKFSTLIVENISHNTLLLKYLLKRKIPKQKELINYYFYNFIHRPFYSTKVFLLN